MHLLWVWPSHYLVFSCEHWFVNMNTSKLNKKQTWPHKSKSRSQSYTSVRHLYSNFPKERYHLLDAKLDLLFMSETSTSMPVPKLIILAYLSLISKHNHQNHHNHGLSAFIKDGFPCGTCPQYHFHFLIYCTLDDGTVIFDWISEVIDNILTDIPQLAFIFVVI